MTRRTRWLRGSSAAVTIIVERLSVVALESDLRAPWSSPLRRFPSSLRCRRFRHVGKLHGRSTVPDFNEVGHANVEHLGQLEEHLERRVALPALDLLEIAIRKPVCRDVLLGQALPPPGLAQVSADPAQEGGEVHPETMAGTCRIIEPIGLACY